MTEKYPGMELVEITETYRKVGTTPTDPPDDPPDPGTDPPVIVYFSSSATEVPVGVSYTLAWQVTGAENVTMDGRPVDAIGTRTVSHDEERERVWTLVATNEYGTAEESLTVSVVEPAPPEVDLAMPIRLANADVKMDIDILCAQPNAAGIVDGSEGVTLDIQNLKILNPAWTCVNFTFCVRLGQPKIRISVDGVDDFPDGKRITVDLLPLVEASDFEYGEAFTFAAKLKIWCSAFNETKVYMIPIFPQPGGQFVRE